MAMKMKATQKFVQKMALTPQMKQSIHILQLPLIELKGYLEQQIEENPALEDVSELESKDAALNEKISKLIESTEEQRSYSESTFNAGYSQEEIQKKQSHQESLITKEPTLQEFLIRQLRMHSLSERDYKIGEFLINSLL